MPKKQKTAFPKKTTGRFATAEEAAQAKNANLLIHIKRLGITAEKIKNDPRQQD